MELRHLRYFVAVADTLHFGRAAAKIGIAQPSLSHQIRQLEAELQTVLLRRTKRRVELTEAGQVFLEEAREIIARSDRAAVIARRMGRVDHRYLRVGIGYLMDCAAVAGCAGALAGQDVHIEIRTMSVRTQLAALSEGRLDVGFVRPPISDPALLSETLIREPLVLALPPTHALASHRSIGLSAVANEPFVLVDRETVPVFYDLVLGACREAGFIPHALNEVDHLDMALAMVAAGAGVSLVPARARNLGQHRVAYRAVRASPDSIETLVAWRRDDASPFVTGFLDIVRRRFAPPRSRGLGQSPS